MTERSNLERRYRRLVRWGFPAAFRRRHDEEMVAVLMACSRDNQRWPSLADITNLTTSGAKMRLRPGAPPPAPPVRVAVRLMHASAAINALYLLVALASSGHTSAFHLKLLGHQFTAVEISRWRYAIIASVALFAGAVVIGWLWMARAVGRGRPWARWLSTALLVLATLELTGDHLGQVLWATPPWLLGAVAVWLLWRPAASASFERGRPLV